MPTVEYFYPRALELEGRHPTDAGCWGITVQRLEVGEGLPASDSPWALVTFPDDAPIPSSSRPPSECLYRNFYYRRIRSAAECDRHLLLDPQDFVHIAFQLTVAWANAPGGLIPPPSAADPPLSLTHAAAILDRIPDKRLFHFGLKWGDWGDRGTGYMPYEFFDRYVFECWTRYGRAEVLKLFKQTNLDGEGRLRWSAHDEDDHRIYAFEVRDAHRDERRAWTFVIERDGALEVEELYVRPEYRRLGHGGWLADCVAQLAREKKLPLRLWVSFADCKAENEANYSALVATARRLGVQFQPCPVAWAAYFGTNERLGAPLPVEPATVPARPRTPRKELLAVVMALGFGNGAATPQLTPPAPVRPAQVAEGAKSTTKPQQQINGFLEEVYRLAQENDLDGATDWVFDFIDRLLCDGQFDVCDEVLRTVDPERLPTALMRSFLAITAPAKGELPSRPALYRVIEQMMIEQRGVEKTRRILANLA